VTISATDPDLAETGLDPGQFTVTRAGPTTFALNVGLSFSGTASYAQDYASVTTTVQIPAGQTSVTVPVTPLSDAFNDPNETIIVALVPSPVTFVLGAQSSATLTIQ
jgi:hypothetical protein